MVIPCSFNAYPVSPIRELSDCLELVKMWLIRRSSALGKDSQSIHQCRVYLSTVAMRLRLMPSQ